MWSNIFIGVCVIILLIIIYFRQKFNYWKHRNVFTQKCSIPFGNALRLLTHKTSIGEEFHKIYNTCKSKSVSYCGYFVFTKPIFVPVELDLIRNIMNNDFDYFMDRSVYSNEDAEPLTGNLFTLKGLKWKRLRTKLTPTFTSTKIKAMFPTLYSCSNSLCTAVDQQMQTFGTVDIKDTVARFTTDVIGSCAFGMDCNSLQNPENEFRQLGRDVFDVSSWQRSLLHLVAIVLPELLMSLKLSLLEQRVDHLFNKTIADTVRYRKENNVVRSDFLQVLIEMKNKLNPTEQFTMNEVSAQCFIFFVAGFETPSSAAIFCLYEIAVNIHIQDKLRKEVQEILNKHNGEVTYDALMEMTYMEQCINESLRKYPPSPVITRKCTKAYPIANSDLVIAKDVTVIIPVLGIQRDPEYYPDPDKFDPERFSPENKANRPPCTWMPFGEGPRTCIALRFGMLQVKLCLVTLLKSYKFYLNPKTDHPLQIDKRASTVLAPKGNVFLNFKKI